MEEATVLAFGSARAAALRSRRFCLQGCKYIAERREKVRSRSGRETGLGHARERWFQPEDRAGALRMVYMRAEQGLFARPSRIRSAQPHMGADELMVTEPCS
jgi:hypothetical protein